MKIAILSPLTLPTGTDFAELIPGQPLANKKVHPHPWVANLAYGLGLLGHEVHVVTLTSNITKNISFIHKNVNYHLLKSTPKLFRIFTLNFFDNKKVQRFITNLNPDIVHGQGRQTDGLSAVKSQFPSIVTSHGEIENELLSYKKNVKYRIKKYFENKVNKKMKFAIGVSPTTTADLKRFLSDSHVLLIDNALDPVFFDNYVLQWQPFVLYVGAISERKRIYELIKAIKDIPEIKLHIASQTPVENTYYQEVEHYIAEKQLQSKVVFLGNLSPHEVAIEISKCLCTVLPSNFESFGMPLAEALSVGKPVIGSNVGGIPYLVEEDKTGFLINPGNVEQIKDKINYLMSNMDIAKKMGKLAKQTAFERWHPESVAKKTLRAYSFVLEHQN